MKDSSTFRVASVDCVKYESLCSRNNVHSYPTIRLYPPGRFSFNNHR